MRALPAALASTSISARQTKLDDGESSSPLHNGSPTDRFVAEWHIREPHVERRISSRSVPVMRDMSVAHAPVVNPAMAGEPWVRPGTADLAIDARRVLVLRVTGLVVAYGSVLVQIARVSVPAHAVALFVLAMVAVAWGARRQQAAILVTGVIAVVLDVVAYLAQRGFQQDFVGSVLLVGAGGSVFVVAARAARARARVGEPPAR